MKLESRTIANEVETETGKVVDAVCSLCIWRSATLAQSIRNDVFAGQGPCRAHAQINASKTLADVQTRMSPADSAEPVLLHGTYAFTSSLRFQNSRAGISSSSEIETCQSWNPDDLEIVGQKRYEYQCKLTIAACYFRSICSLNTWLCHMHPVGVSGGLVPREKATCLEFNLKVKSSLFGCPHSQTRGSPWQRCCDAIYPRCFWTCQGVAESSNTLGYLLLFTWGFASPWSRQPLSGWMLLAWLACGMPRFAAQIRQRQLAHA